MTGIWCKQTSKLLVSILLMTLSLAVIYIQVVCSSSHLGLINRYHPRQVYRLAGAFGYDEAFARILHVRVLLEEGHDVMVIAE